MSRAGEGSAGFDHPELQCEVARLNYDFTRKRGRLDMAEGDCCDMAACVALFQRIDPNVRSIETFSGEARDTSYHLRQPGEWIALDGEGKRWC